MAWTFVDKFNSDTKSTGTLNGQDGWSGDVSWQVVTTQKYDGDQAIKRLCEGDAPSGVENYKAIANTFTGVTSGTLYIAFRADITGGNTRTAITLREGTTYKAMIFFTFNSTTKSIQHSPPWVTVETSLSADTWYPLAIELDCSTDQFRVKAYVSGAWGSFTSWSNFATTATSIDKFQVGSDKGAAGDGGTIYLDTITDTDPTVAGPTNLKTWLGLVKASVKTADGLAIASIKTANGLT